MILITLGTQDKPFTRLLENVEKEIEKGNITDEVVVQAGYTKFDSKYMKIFDLVDRDEFQNLINSCDLLITHGGVGSILTGIKRGKPVIAAARLKKYKEHTNDHQKQIIKEFSDAGYILELRDFNKLGKMIEKAKSFKAKKFESNTHNMVKLLDDYIEKDNHTSWYNKYREVLLYLVFGGLTTLINIVAFYILRKLSLELQVSNVIAWILSVLFAFITNKLFVFESKNKSKKENFKEMTSFFGFRVLSLLFDIGFMHLLVSILNIHEMISKILSNILVIILNYIFSKLFIFKK
jgi:putative flippase GtrA/UDP-N-acetylglucosamine transferase subunit ALG13